MAQKKGVIVTHILEEAILGYRIKKKSFFLCGDIS